MPTASKRRRMRPEVRREHVLDAALVQFAARGYRVSLDEIAKAVGATRTVVYHYFPTKKDLYLAVQERELVELVRHVAPAMTSTGTYEQRARMLLTATFAFAEAHPHGWDLLFGHPDDHDTEVSDATTRVRMLFKASATALLADDIERLGVDGTSPEADLLFDVLIGFVVTTVSWWRNNPTADSDAIIDFVARFGGAAINGVESTDLLRTLEPFERRSVPAA